MRVSTKEIRDGLHDGKQVWICHYLQPDLDKKPLRSVPPQLVIVRPISDLPKGKKVYYSESFFSPINLKTGKPLSKVISPVDNTGYRGRPGNELYVFDSEEECRNSWNDQVNECCIRIDFEIRDATRRLEVKKLNLLDLIC